MQAVGETAFPEVLVSLRNTLPIARVVRYTEGNTRSSVMVRMRRSGGVLKPWHA